MSAAPPAFRRLILDVGDHAANPRIARAAAEFARALGLDLHCVFVEDEAVYGLAGLPFARELRLPAHEWHPMDATRIASEFAQAAAQARRVVDEVVRTLGIANAFEVVRGDPAACIAVLSTATDIVVVAERGAPGAWPFDRRRAAAYRSAAALLVLPPRPASRQGPIAAVLAAAADACLEVAARAARSAGASLLLLPLALPPDQLQAAIARATARATALGVPPDRIAVRPVAGPGLDALLHALAGSDARLVVLTRAADPPQDDTPGARIARAHGAPVLLLEPRGTVPAEG